MTHRFAGRRTIVTTLMAMLAVLLVFSLPSSAGPQPIPLSDCFDPVTGAITACGGTGGVNPDPTPVPGEPGEPGSTPVPPGGGSSTTIECNTNGVCDAGEPCYCGGCGPCPFCGDGECNEPCYTCYDDCGTCTEGTTMNYTCMPWSDCASDWANVTGYYASEAADIFVVTDVTCVSEEACTAATPVPGTPDSDWPCEDPPNLGGGSITQWATDCEWGCDTCATVSIPPAAVLRNPWPRGLCGLRNYFWYLGGGDVEKWSDECVPCDLAAAGVTHDEPFFDCDGDGDGDVGEGDKVKYQIGVAWRQWNVGDGAVFAGASTPPSEYSWVVHDREKNGGTQFFFNVNPLMYTFETSSYGLPPDGPTWKPECQDADPPCDCDERILDTRGTEAYDVNILTYWWPEWNVKWLEYECVGGENVCESWPGWGAAGCDLDGDGVNDPDTKSSYKCDLWGWREHNQGWEKYDIRLAPLNAPSPYVSWGSAIVGGADPEGNRCTFTIGGSGWIDSVNIPVPVIEIQPVGVGW